MRKNKTAVPVARAASAKHEKKLLESLVVTHYDDSAPEIVKYGRFHKYIHHAKMLAGLALLTVVLSNAWVALNYRLKVAEERKTAFLAGVVVVNEDRRAATKELVSAAKSQKINIVINGTTYSYSAEQLGIKRDFSSMVDYIYPPPDTLLNKFTGDNSSPALRTYVQRGRLVSTIESRLGQYKTAVDASVSVNGGDLVANPSRAGIILDFDKLTKQIEKTDLTSDVTLTASMATKQPEILTQAAQAAKAKAAALIAPAYGVSSDSRAKLATAAQKAGWLVFAPNNYTRAIDVTLNTQTAKSSLTKIAQSFTQPLKARVTLTTSEGSTTLLDDGQPGVTLDQTSLSSGLDQFETAINSHQPYTAPVKLTIQPQGERNLGTATGGKFVLVDLAGFKAYAIDNTAVDRTMLISSGRPGLETPKGHFSILRKTRLVTMTGCNKMVGCWTVPNVPNAEFFTGEGHALHGTYWHNRFGQANLSHGCVNLSLSDAAWLYDWTQVGTDVVVV
jgi:lipoprotein-anchoring transpeptidase ErfK/SrfK